MVVVEQMLDIRKERRNKISPPYREQKVNGLQISGNSRSMCFQGPLQLHRDRVGVSGLRVGLVGLVNHILEVG